ncbi:MAG: metallophosphoesterase [Planctomycetota bacterium]
MVPDALILFTADVHLGSEDRGLVNRFLRFLESAPGGATVILLGDIFDRWVGPGQENIPPYREVLETVADIRRRGRLVRWLDGNRDFLIGRHLRRTGLADVAAGEALHLKVGGENPVALTALHGDVLFPHDAAYRLWRRISRSRLFQKTSDILPFPVRSRLGRGLRFWSDRKNLRTRSVEFSVSPGRAIPFFRAGADAIVHGHAHREGMTEISTPWGAKRIFSLGAWNETGGSVLRVENGEFHFERF